MQYSQYVVDETVGLVAICVVAVDSSPSMRKNVTFIITTNGTATGKDHKDNNIKYVLALCSILFCSRIGLHCSRLRYS